MITVWQVPKKLSIELPYDSVIPPLPIYPKELKAGFRHLYTNAHSSSIHNGQKRKTIQMSTTDKTDKQNVICAHIGVLFSLKKE